MNQKQKSMNFIPYAKMSKKARHAYDLRKRGSWNGVNPVTRPIQSGKLYNRSKAKKDVQARMKEDLRCLDNLFTKLQNQF